MAHFARLDDQNNVIAVHVVNNSELIVDGEELESKGIEFLKNLYGANTNWKQTSYNGSIRKNYAGIGYAYDADLDAFIPPKPYNSWILNTDLAQWEAPVAMPDDGNMYLWDEASTSWQLIPSGNSD